MTLPLIGKRLEGCRNDHGKRNCVDKVRNLRLVAAALCDFTANLKGQLHGGLDYEIASTQPMAALFEQSIFLFVDIIIQLLMKKLNVTKEQMAKRHTNLDGYMDFNVEQE